MVKGSRRQVISNSLEIPDPFLLRLIKQADQAG